MVKKTEEVEELLSEVNLAIKQGQDSKESSFAIAELLRLKLDIINQLCNSYA